MITIITARVSPHQKTHASSLAMGLSAHGIKSKTILYGERIDTKFVACWGWRIGKELRRCGHEVLIMERGYIGDRFSYTSLGWNGLNGHAEFPEYPDDGGERFRQHGVEIKPWKEGGEYALILGQVPNDASLKGQNIAPWYEQTAMDIWNTYGIPVHFRPHPDLAKKNKKQFISGTTQSEGNLQDALSRALFTVSYNSNSSVDSVLAGIPAIVGDRGTMAYEVCSRSINNIVRPDRQSWAHRLAWTQWNIDEIKSGYALEGICKRMQS